MKVRRTQAPMFEEYVNVVRRLRKECPWDREQTHQSIRHSLLEEAYEVLEAIDHENWKELKQELGDLLLHVTMHAIMAEEQGSFSLQDVLETAREKMIRRHPHVFGNAQAGTAREVKSHWEKIKLTEGRQSIIDGVPRELPSLLRAWRIQEKASKVGFDWEHSKDVLQKVHEEADELEAAEKERKEEEFGDLLFSLVNYARFLDVNPELALKKTIEKFIRRFQHVERELGKRGKRPEDVTLEEMDELWNEKKSMEKR